MKLLPTSFLRIVSSLIILFMVATGCTTTQTYPGPQLSPEKLAKLEGTYNYYFICDVECVIAAVDGKGFYGTVEMLPGKHAVTLYLTYSCYKGPTNYGVSQTFSFVAEAGHVYKADGNWHGGDNQIWIIDKKTGKVVAGMKPLPHEKVARLKGKRLFSIPLCAIAAVDGKIMSDDFTMEAEMLPGKHEVTIKLIEPFIPPIWRFSFVAEAGHVYQVDGYWKVEKYWHVVGNQIWIWIIDKETGQVVAGEKP
ncbi:MAG: hypothetical protein ABIJ37_06615 [Pseudomonadota bacterium]